MAEKLQDRSARPLGRSPIRGALARFGWKPGTYNGRAIDLLASNGEGAVSRAGLQVPEEDPHNRRFLDLLWESRPRLVAAVALWREVRHLHPAIHNRKVIEPRENAARIELKATILRACRGAYLEKSGNSTVVCAPRPDWSEVVNASLDTSSARKNADRHVRMIFQLGLLGWGHWNVEEGGEALRRTAGGGPPQPQWGLDCEPEELDRDPPGEVLEAPMGWWLVEADEAQLQPPPHGRRTLRTEVVGTIWRHLDCPDPGLEANRRDVADHVPDLWPELHDARRRDGDGRDTPLANTLRNLHRRQIM